MNTPDGTPPRVFDPLLRLLHWWIALAVALLIATSQLSELFEDRAGERLWWQWHIVSGYALAAGLMVRLLWALVGPATARGSDLWHPAAWRGMLALRWPRPRRGHDAAAALAFIGFYLVVLMMVLTGLGLAATEFHTGPLAGLLGGMHRLEEVFEAPHEAGFALILGFIGVHLAALIYHHWRGERVAQAMLTGRSHLDAGPDVPRPERSSAQI